MATLTTAQQIVSDLAYLLLLGLSIGGLWVMAHLAQSVKNRQDKHRGH